MYVASFYATYSSKLVKALRVILNERKGTNARVIFYGVRNSTSRSADKKFRRFSDIEQCFFNPAELAWPRRVPIKSLQFFHFLTNKFVHLQHFGMANQGRQYFSKALVCLHPLDLSRQPVQATVRTRFSFKHSN